MEFKDLILEKIKLQFDKSLQLVEEFRGDLSITFNPNQIVDLAFLLRDDPELHFEMCEDVTAIDWATRKNRFTIIYHIYSFKNNFRLRIKANLEKEVIDTVSGVWASANWYERETFDMYGIKFNNHPDLRRMYMPEEYQYYPLRKDFPLMGIPGSIPLPKK
ncbi:MAG: NADH-quinone oxidoreductase subunit C [Ignavibacteriales bacterium]|nr:NADH-quinone oxidoreductase subunit C [Ignavibacteriales bacterium]